MGGAANAPAAPLLDERNHNSVPGGSTGVPPVNHGREIQLMRRVRARWGANIREACQYSSISPAFMAALIAVESGGDAKARRHEPAVFQKLRAVRDGALRNYGSMRAEDLAGATDAQLKSLATSWGLTQIMGYHMLAWGKDPEALLDPIFNLDVATRLLGHFAQRYQLDLRQEFKELLGCWNTGGPYGETHDPQYRSNGLARMEIYARLEAEGR